MRGISVVAFEAESFGGQLINLYPSKPVTNFPAQPPFCPATWHSGSPIRLQGSAPNSRTWSRWSRSTTGPDGFVLTQLDGREMAALR